MQKQKIIRINNITPFESYYILNLAVFDENYIIKERVALKISNLKSPMYKDYVKLVWNNFGSEDWMFKKGIIK